MEMNFTPSTPRAGSTPSSRTASRAAGASNSRAAVGPFRSASSTPTARPARARARARWAVAQVLPTRPWRLTTASTRPTVARRPATGRRWAPPASGKRARAGSRGWCPVRRAKAPSVKEDALPRDRVGFGPRVTVQDLDTKKRETYALTLGEFIEGDDDTAELPVSMASPLGKALLGGKVGQTVAITLPLGKRRLKIVELETVHDLAEKKV